MLKNIHTRFLKQGLFNRLISSVLRFWKLVQIMIHCPDLSFNIKQYISKM